MNVDRVKPGVVAIVGYAGGYEALRMPSLV
jgi:hypothetical protein